MHPRGIKKSQTLGPEIEFYSGHSTPCNLGRSLGLPGTGFLDHKMWMWLYHPNPTLIALILWILVGKETDCIAASLKLSYRSRDS